MSDGCFDKKQWFDFKATLSWLSFSLLYSWVRKRYFKSRCSCCHALYISVSHGDLLQRWYQHLRAGVWGILDGVLKLLRFNGLTIERGRKELVRFSLWYHVRCLKYWNWDLKSLSCSPVIVFSYLNVAISWESWKICIKAFKPDKRA